MGAVARVRNALSYATHRFYQDRDFLYLHTPLITASDAEGVGEMFRVTTLDMENLENNSRQPDINIFNTQSDWISGGDPQLLRAIEELITDLR